MRQQSQVVQRIPVPPIPHQHPHINALRLPPMPLTMEPLAQLHLPHQLITPYRRQGITTGTTPSPHPTPISRFRGAEWHILLVPAHPPVHSHFSFFPFAISTPP